MKIEFLNPECTEAIVTRGWWRKRQAHVERGSYRWQFVSTGRQVSAWVNARIDAAFSREIRRRDDEVNAGREWVDTAPFPKARLLERRS